MIRAKPVGRGAEYSIGFATSRRSCARRTSRCHQAVAYGAGTTAINLLPLRIKSRNKLFSSSHLAPSSAKEPNLCERVGTTVRGKVRNHRERNAQNGRGD